MPGDQLNVQARVRNGEVIGLRVRVEDDGPGYGTAGDRVFVLRGEVVDKSTDTFTIESRGTTTTFKVLASTRFFRTSFATLSVGQNVMVRGEDSGTEFIARRVVR